MNKSLSNIFATANTTSAQVAQLLKVALPLMQPSPDGRTAILSWAKVEAALPGDDAIGYARGWLIVRRAYLEANQANLIVDTATMVEAARKQAEAKNQLNGFDPVRTVLGPVVADLKDVKLLSWGEIMCRCGLTEGQARKAYRALDAKKDVGVRNGHGGAFAYGDGTLYRDNRKSQGAWIPTTIGARKPTEQELLNYVPKDGEAAAAPKAAAKRAPKAPATAKPVHTDGLTQAQRKAARKVERANAAKVA